MKFMPGTVIIIPSRMAAKRLPGKPLLKLNNKTIITNVFKRAEKAGLGTVYVATEDEEIYEEVKKNVNGSLSATCTYHKSKQFVHSLDTTCSGTRLIMLTRLLKR